MGQRCQAPGNLGFTHSGGTDHNNIFRCNFVAQLWIELLAPPAISQGNGNCPFGIVLADDVFVELFNNFAWG